MKKHKIFIDAGGWYLAYYLGVFHYIFEEFGTTIFEDVYFEGISAGAHTSGYCLATIYGCHDNKYWLDNGPKQTVKKNKYNNALFTLGMYEAGKFFYDQLDEFQRSKIHEYFCSICIDTNRNPYKCIKITTANEFGSAVASSANIPFLGSIYAWRFRDVFLWDGYMNDTTIYDNIHTDCVNVLFITFDAKRINIHPAYVLLDLSEWTDFSILNSLLPSLYTQYMTLNRCDELFEMGYCDAKKHKDQIREKLTSFGILDKNREI
jgi:hypothetical protein